MLPLISSLLFDFFDRVEEKCGNSKEIVKVFDTFVIDNTCRICDVYCFRKEDMLDTDSTCNNCNWNKDWKRTKYGNPRNENKCKGTKRIKCDDYECKKCFRGSFMSSDKAKHWNYALNGVASLERKRPREVSISSNNKFYFDCCECKHSFQAQLASITAGTWCPYCAKHKRKLCDETDCDWCINKSFASSDKAKYWSKKNEKKPRDITISTDKKFYFDCGECKHTFETQLDNITGGSWCPYCANKKLCEEKDCNWCFDKSFASSNKAKYWSKKNEKNPRDVTISTKKKFYFDCGECKHSFQSQLTHITGGSWCPYCKKKTEAKMKTFLSSLSDFILICQPKFDWCRSPETKRYYPFDFLLHREAEESKESKTRIIIELDGPQHFRQVSNWQSHDVTRERDRYKSKLALENSYSVIRICQEDVFSDTIDWKKKLKETIKMILLNGEINVHYIAKDMKLYV